MGQQGQEPVVLEAGERQRHRGQNIESLGEAMALMGKAGIDRRQYLAANARRSQAAPIRPSQTPIANTMPSPITTWTMVLASWSRS